MNLTVQNYRDNLYNLKFGAMVKSQFSGVDLYTVVKYKAPIKKFKSHADYLDWVKIQISRIKEKDYQGRLNKTILGRKQILDVWFKKITDQKSLIPPSLQLLILSGITSMLEYRNDTLPPMLKENVLNDTINSINERLEKDKYAKFNFNKLYSENLRKFYLKDFASEDFVNYTGWVKIPSKENDSSGFKDNVEKLISLSSDTWCTKSCNVENALMLGDFYIYLEKGQTKVGAKFIADKIDEIQGVENNDSIPPEYIDIIESFIKEKNCDVSEECLLNIKRAKKLKN